MLAGSSGFLGRRVPNSDMKSGDALHVGKAYENMQEHYSLLVPYRRMYDMKGVFPDTFHCMKFSAASARSAQKH